MSTDVPLQIEAVNPNFSQTDNSLAVVPRPAAHIVPRQPQTSPAVPYQPAATYLSSPGDPGKQGIPPYDIPSPAAGRGRGGIPVAVAMAENQAEVETMEEQFDVTQHGGVVGLKNTKTKVHTRVNEKTVAVQDEHGNMHMLKRTIVEQRVYQEIAHVLVLDARKFIADGYDEVKPTCCEKSIDLCCQSLVCKFQNPFKSGAHAVNRNEIMSATLRRGRAKGWNIYSQLVLPLVRDVVRDVWVFFQLLFVLVMLGLSIATFVTAADNYKVYNALHLALSILFFVLVIVDGIMTFGHCSTCKACLARCQAKRRGESFWKTDTESQNSTTSGETTSCHKCCLRSKPIFDFFRLLFTELILVPIIFCDMFEVAIGKGFSSVDVSHRLGFSLMIIDSIGFLIFVFLIRLLILGRSMRSIQRAHPSKSAGRNLYMNKDYNIDPLIKKNSLQIQIVFFLHVFGQMLGQTLMLVAVGAKIAYDNRVFGFFKSTPVNNVPAATPYLWYMMVATYLLPMFGIATFFIVNNYWVQQFLIGLCIDFVKVLQIGEDDKQSIFSAGKERASEEISNFVRITKLEEEYKQMRKRNFCDKFLYPFRSPVLVVICLAYMVSQLAFVICGAFAFDELGKADIVFLNDGGWTIYYFVAAALGVIINIYSFLVAGLWLLIIAGIIAAVAMVIMFCCLLIFCAAAASDNN